MKNPGRPVAGRLAMVLAGLLPGSHERQRPYDTDTLLDERAWWHASAHLHEIREFVDHWSGNRDLDCLDLFSPKGRIKKVWGARGKTAVNYDIKSGGKQHDVSGRVGCMFLLAFILRLKPGAMVMAGPPCSLFIYLSSSIHQRRVGLEEGDVRHHSVRLANLIVANMMVLLQIAHSRGVFFVLEQPSTSWMFKMLVVVAAFEGMGTAVVPRVTTWMRAFGHEIPKCSHLVGTLPTLHFMRRSLNTRLVPRVTSYALWARTAAGGIQALAKHLRNCGR